MRRPLSVNGAYEALARFVVRFRVAIVVFWLLVAVVTTATLPSLASEVNDNNSAFLQSSAPSTKPANLAAPLLGGGAAGKISEITIVAARSGPLTNADLAAIAREASLARSVQTVQSVTELGLSADGEAAQIRVRAQLSASDIVKDKSIIDSLQSTFAHANVPAGLQLHLAGQVATVVANQASSNKSGNKVQAFSLLFIIVLLCSVRSRRRS